MSLPKLPYLGWALMAIMLLSACSSLMAQQRPLFLQQCPYRAESWPLPAPNTNTCPIAVRPDGVVCPSNYRIKAHQDCCGALPLCSLINTVYSVRDPRGNTSGYQASICGQGCKPNEMPNPGSSGTCFGVRERQTSWYIFEVQPLRGGGKNKGDFAGWLRMKIYPCDVPPNNPNCDGTGSEICDCDSINPFNPAFCSDGGCSGIGSTDYDWQIFDITNLPSRRTACNKVSATTLSITPGNGNIFSCNWSGTSGPTGMGDLGSGDNNPAAGCRLNRIREVYVGQRFLLAVDGYTATNLKGYKIDFTGGCQYNNQVLPTANVSPKPSGSKLMYADEDTNYCATNLFKIHFDYPYTIDSLINSDTQTPKAKKFKIVNMANVFDSTTYQVQDLIPTNGAFDTAANYQVKFGGPVNAGRYRMVFTDTLRAFCGNVYIKDTVYFKIKPFLTAVIPDQKIYCAADRDPANRPVLWARFDTTQKFDKDTLPVMRTKWVLLSYGATGNKIGDSVYNNYKYGSMTVRNFPKVNGPTNWKKATQIVVTDTVSEKDVNNVIPVRHRFRCFVTMPYDPQSTYSTATGCVDSVDFEVTFKPVPYAKTDSISVACAQGPLARLRAVSRITDRTLTWRRYPSRLTAVGSDSVGTGLGYEVPKSEGEQYYRVYVRDTSSGITCDATYPAFDKPAITVINAKNIISRFKIDYRVGSSASFPVTAIYTNTSLRIVNGTDTVPVTDADSLVCIWNLDDGNGSVSTYKVSDVITKTFDRPNRISADGSEDSLEVNPTLTVYDPLAKNLNIPACVNETTNRLVVKVPFFPNVILPGDNDPRNDYLVFQKRDDIEIKLEVFNRWGNMIYKMDKYDGKFNGDGHPAGLYYYIASRGGVEPVKGWVQIIK